MPSNLCLGGISKTFRIYNKVKNELDLKINNKILK